MQTYGASILEEVREGIRTHGSVAAFLNDEEASFNVTTMYIADYFSVKLGVTLVRLEDLKQEVRESRMWRDVHVTDGSTVIVTCNLKPHITYDDCAPFFGNAIGFDDGAIAAQWKHIILARRYDSTICADLEALTRKGPLEWKFNVGILEVLVHMLITVSEHTEVDKQAEREEPETESERAVSKVAAKPGRKSAAQ